MNARVRLAALLALALLAGCGQPTHIRDSTTISYNYERTQTLDHGPVTYEALDGEEYVIITFETNRSIDLDRGDITATNNSATWRSGEVFDHGNITRGSAILLVSGGRFDGLAEGAHSDHSLEFERDPSMEVGVGA